MSKADAQRAMREAKYDRDTASRREGAAAGRAPMTPVVARTPDTGTARPAAADTPAPDGARCGHKSMNGRACTREAAHSEKSHRYS